MISRRTEQPTERLVYPSRDVLARRGSLNAGEWKVLDSLDRALPPEWELYVQPHLNGLRPDVFCLHPTGAAVVVEVKDWTFVDWDLGWQTRAGAAPLPIASRGSQQLRQRNPVEQVYGYRSMIAELSAANVDGACLDVQGVLIFPFADREKAVTGLSPALEHRRTTDIAIVGAAELDAIGTAKVFRPRTGGRRDASVAAIRDWLVEAEEFVTSGPVALTSRQRSLVTSRTASGYRRIRGAPGAGKSLVVAGRAAQLSREGCKVLVVCFNYTLVGYLRRLGASFGARDANITWLGFHEWCQRVMVETGRHAEYRALWSNGNPRRILDEDLPQAVALALDADGSRLATRYDAVLVDEGQDILPEWWACLRRLCTSGGEMVLAADPGQNLFGRADVWTEARMTGAGFAGPWFDLGVSHRMPRPLISKAREFAKTFLPTAEALLPEEPRQLRLPIDACELVWRQISPFEVVQETVRATEELVTAIASRPVPFALDLSQLVVLVDTNDRGREVVNMLAGRGIKVVHTFSSSSGRSGRAAKKAIALESDCPRATTPYCFKGLEAPAIVVCIASGSRQTSLAMLYSAITRLKATPGGSMLTVVSSEPRLAAYGRSWNP